MKQNIFYLLIAISIAFYLLSPGVWLGDSLNAYIQGVNGIYGTAQPVLLAHLCTITRSILPGSFILFSICIVLYFIGFYVMIFENVKHKIFAPVFFFCMSFCPILFANIGVVQTEAIQLGVLAFFIPLTILLYKSEGKKRNLLFILLFFCLAIFSLVRYDTLHIVFLLCYWLVFSFYKIHGRKALITTLLFLGVFYIIAKELDGIAKIQSESKSAMTNALLVTDMAAISAQTGVDYIPAYCWQDYLPQEEKSVERIQYGMKEWRGSFFSYLYNIDPKVGLFTYNIQKHEDDLRQEWLRVVFKHPFYFLKYHLTILGYLLDNENFNLGLWGGLKDSYTNHASIAIEKSKQLDDFLQVHKPRFIYKNGSLILDKDDTMITIDEEKEILKLVDRRREADVSWMKWYSQIPSKTYMLRNERAEKYVQPFMVWYKESFRWVSILFLFFLSEIVMLIFFSKKIKDSYLRFTFIILCACGILHLGIRAIVVTDAVFRFGLLSILFCFYAFVILFSELKPKLSFATFSIGVASLSCIYLGWEVYWYRIVGLTFIKWHTHLAFPIIFMEIAVAFCFLLKKADYVTSSKFQNILLTVGSVFAVIFFLEIILLLTSFNKTETELYGGNYISNYISDKKNVYHNWEKHGSSHYLKTSEFDYLRSTNRDGYCDKEWIVNDTSKRIKILCMGDSFTEGDGAPQDSCYPFLLNQILENKYPGKYEVMNGGTCGSDPFFNFKAYCEVLNKYKPKYVIQIISINDVLVDYAIRGGLERFEKEGVVTYQKSLWWEPIYAISYLSRIVFNVLGKNYGELPIINDWGKMQNDFKNLFMQYKSVTDSNNCRLIICILPLNHEVRDKKYDLNFKFLNSHNVINLLSIYNDSLEINEENFQQYYWKKDNHHNSKGYLEMAKGVEIGLENYLTY